MKDKQLLELITIALGIWEDEQTVALEWFLNRNLATDNKKPIELLDTEEGFERVKNLLLRIEYGVLA